MPIIAGIDIGTNTVRLLIAEVDPGRHFRECYAEQHITRLGEGPGPGSRPGIDRRLRSEAIDRTLIILKAFAQRIQEAGVETTVAVATSAVREAVNQAEFLQRVKTEIGLEVKVLSGDDEARQTYRGVAYALDGDDLLLIDIGGGSTEFVQMIGGTLTTMSTRLGTVQLTETYLASDPPQSAELRALWDAAEQHLRGAVKRTGTFDGPRPGLGLRLVGTAGTVTTLAAMQLGLDRYDSHRVHGSVLTRQSVSQLWDRLGAQSIAERLAAYPSLEPGRADLVVAGSAIVLIAMLNLGVDRMLVSESGLREGIILTHLDRLPWASRVPPLSPDPPITGRPRAAQSG